MRRILVIEDDEGLREELKILLKKNGYEGVAVEQFDNLLPEIIKTNADLILLDINLPYTDGENLLRQLRKESDVPVIMVTSKNTEIDEVLCMSYGADDFIAKPYNPSILLLHIEAIFKRMGSSTKNILEMNHLKLDLSKGVFMVDGKETELSKNEMKILGYLMDNKGRIVSRDELISYLWDNEEFVDDNTLTVNINRVRKKLEERGLVDIIKTKRGQGYIIG
ncbi:MAG: response regulator transcription factor [Eubacterium sp.]